MDILNGLLDGTGNNSKDIIPVILILILVLGAGKNTGFNLFNTSDGRSSRTSDDRSSRTSDDRSSRHQR